MRKQFVKTVTQVLRENEKTVLFLGDIGVFGFRDAFEEFKGRVFNIGILEQATISLAAGWALRGYIPVVHTIAPFMVERAYEQLKIDFGYHGLPGIFASVGGSYDYGKLGCTHHCPADVSLIENIPGFEIAIPGHDDELDASFKRALKSNRPTYIRMSEHTNANAYELGQSEVRRRFGTTRVNVLAVGPCLDMVAEAAKDLNDVTVLYQNILHSDSFPPIQAFRNTLVVEPYYRSSLCQQISEASTKNRVVRSMCVPKRFIKEYGTKSEIDKITGFTIENIRSNIAAL